MKSSDDLATFKQSMEIGYYEWHDGIGYDLDVLSRLKGDELQVAEDLLVARNLADWRDVEALDRIGSERALAELSRGLDSRDLSVRGEVLSCLINRGMLSDEQIDDAMVSALRCVSLLNGLTKILGLANSHRSPRVRKELFRTAMDGEADSRCHAAALAHFVHGGSASMFDEAFGSLYRRFSSESRTERVAAFRELCELIHLDADALLADFATGPTRPWWRLW
jgi:hypothetical protein